MKPSPPSLRLLCLGLVAVGGASSGSAQQWLGPNQEPTLFTGRLNQLYTGVYAEGYSQETTVTGQSSHETRWFVGPLLGFDLGGAIYHPNFMAYHLSTDGSLGWQTDDVSGSSGNLSSEELRFLGSFTGEIAFLDNKPFHGRVFANYTHTYQDYDFFNRVYVDLWRYGGNLYYLTGPLTFHATASRELEDTTGFAYPLNSDTTRVAFDVNHARASGSSALATSWSQYTRNDFGTPSDGQDYSLTLSDAEDFGSRKQLHSQVNLSYNHIESLSNTTNFVNSINNASDLYTANGNLRVEHTDRLTGLYNLNASRNDYDYAGIESVNKNLNGSANLQHQLFDSLTTDLRLQGYQYDTSSGTNRQESWQIGGGPGFNYTKRLGAHATLSAFEALNLSHTDIQSSGGVITVRDEAHSFGTASGGFFSLRQPNVVLASIIVTDTSNNPPLGYRPGIDYDIIQNGQLVVIQRRVGSIMPDSVLVDYTFYPSPSGAYNTVNNNCGVRLEFFDNRWAVYARLNINQNSGDPYLIIEDLVDLVVGTEGTWRSLRAGVEYENYDSSLAPYEAVRFYQSILLMLDEQSSLSINFTEAFLDYQAANRSEEDYTGILRYTHNLTRQLAANLELGASRRIGEGLDQTLAVFRPQLRYTAGKFSATVGYDFGYDEYLNTQERIRNMGFVRLRKDF